MQALYAAIDAGQYDWVLYILIVLGIAAQLYLRGRDDLAKTSDRSD